MTLQSQPHLPTLVPFLHIYFPPLQRHAFLLALYVISRECSVRFTPQHSHTLAQCAAEAQRFTVLMGKQRSAG